MLSLAQPKSSKGEAVIDPLETLRRVYSQPTAYAAERKAEGVRVVGYFCDSLPIELIQAAGLLPLRITGYPAPAPEVLESKLFALLPKGFWQVRQSSLEFLNHSFGRLVDGSYSMLNALVIPNTRKPLLNMYGQLRAAQASLPDLKLPHLFVLDRAATRVDSARAFNRESVAKFRGELEAWLGVSIPEKAIRAALEVRQATSQRLRTVLSWRRTKPAGIAGTDVLSLIGSAMFMGSEDYGALIREVVSEGPKPQPPGVRVFIGGSPPDNDQLYRLVESLGATVVGEDHCWGERYADFEIDTGQDAMASLAQRWDCSAACGFRLPYEATLANVIRRAQASNADAVILNVFRNDEMQVWDTPGQIAALEAAGFPVLTLADQPHVLGRREALLERVDTFLRSVRASAVMSA